jgi:alpha-L-fucosidase
MLADIVSKNGNLLLSIPVRADGTIDEDEQKILEGIAAWMDVNREAIFGTRPWKVFGEGPASEGAPIQAQGFNEGKGKPFTAEDVRFTTKGNTLYAIVLGAPTKPVVLQSLAPEKVAGIQLLGSAEKVLWKKSADALIIEPPAKLPSGIAAVFKVKL